MGELRCERKETLEAKVRDAVVHEKELENQLPEPKARKQAQEQVELASLDLKDHIAKCQMCQQKA